MGVELSVMTTLTNGCIAIYIPHTMASFTMNGNELYLSLKDFTGDVRIASRCPVANNEQSNQASNDSNRCHTSLTQLAQSQGLVVPQERACGSPSPVSSLTCPRHHGLPEVYPQKAPQQSEAENSYPTPQDVTGISSQGQYTMSSPVLHECQTSTLRHQTISQYLSGGDNPSEPPASTIVKPTDTIEDNKPASHYEDSSESDHNDQYHIGFSVDEQDSRQRADHSNDHICQLSSAPCPPTISDDLKRSYPCLSDGESEEANEDMTVTERRLQQAKRVRFTDGVDITNHNVEDDPKAPWEIVPAVDERGELQPSSRWGGTLTRLDSDRVCLIGGESDHNLLQEIHTLNLLERKWEKGLAGCDGAEALHLNQARSWHTATKVGTKIYLFGGEVNDGNNERKQTADLLLLDTSYGLWVPVHATGVAPSSRAGHSATLLPDGETVCVFGGISGSKWLADSYLLNIGQLTWTKCKAGSRSARPSARSYASLTTCGPYLVLFGGNNKTRSFNDVTIGVVERKRNIVSITWTEPLMLGGAMPAPRTGHVAVASGNGDGVIIAGGWDDLGAQRIFHSDVWELCIHSRAECRWRQVHAGCGRIAPPSQPGARAGAALSDAGPGNEPAVLYGGFRGFQYLGDAFTLDLGKCSVQKSQ